MITAVEASSSEPSLTIAPTRQQTISTLAGYQDVLSVVLQLEGPVRGVQTLIQVKVPGYVKVFNQLWQQIAPKWSVRALSTRTGAGSFIPVFAIGFLSAALCAWMDYGIRVRRVLVLTLLVLSWLFLMEEG